MESYHQKYQNHLELFTQLTATSLSKNKYLVVFSMITVFLDSFLPASLVYWVEIHVIKIL